MSKEKKIREKKMKKKKKEGKISGRDLGSDGHEVHRIRITQVTKINIKNRIIRAQNQETYLGSGCCRFWSNERVPLKVLALG